MLVQVLQWDPKSEKEMKLGMLAEVSGVWVTADAAALSALEDMHIWSRQYVEQRLSWRAKQPLTVLELRCRRLKPPLIVPSTDSLWGCFSFAKLEGVSLNDLPPSESVLGEGVFAERQRALRCRLEGFNVQDVWS